MFDIKRLRPVVLSGSFGISFFRCGRSSRAAGAYAGKAKMFLTTVSGMPLILMPGSRHSHIGADNFSRSLPGLRYRIRSYCGIDSV